MSLVYSSMFPQIAANRVEAFNTGSVRYRGKPCKEGHTVRYTSNCGCVQCAHNRTAEPDNNNKMVAIDHLLEDRKLTEDYYFDELERAI